MEPPPALHVGRDAWPLTEDVFRRIYASREPFWARLARGDDDYEVYFHNDRGAIYALGFKRTSPFGHSINVAELLVLEPRPTCCCCLPASCMA